MALGFDDGKEELQQSKAGGPDCFVAIDMVSTIAAAKKKDQTNNIRLQLQKTLSRKGSQRGGGGETKVAEVAMASEVESLARAAEAEASTAGGRWRRVGKRQSTWLDPRRVLLLFATLSSMGTMVLLYFTLTIRKMNGEWS